MATVRQKMAIGYLVENGGSVYKAMIASGYTPATAKTPQKLTTSVGFKEAAMEAGLTEQFLLDALVEDVKNKPNKRAKEIELGFKVLGTLNPVDKNPSNNTYNTQVNINDSTPRGDKMVDDFTTYMLNQTMPKEPNV